MATYTASSLSSMNVKVVTGGVVMTHEKKIQAFKAEIISVMQKYKFCIGVDMLNEAPRIEPLDNDQECPGIRAIQDAEWHPDHFI